MAQFSLNDINKQKFDEETGSNDDLSNFSANNSDAHSAMLSRFDGTVIMEDDVILTSRRSYMREVLVRQLKRSHAVNSAGFDCAASPYL